MSPSSRRRLFVFLTDTWRQYRPDIDRRTTHKFHHTPPPPSFFFPHLAPACTFSCPEKGQDDVALMYSTSLHSTASIPTVACMFPPPVPTRDPTSTYRFSSFPPFPLPLSLAPIPYGERPVSKLLSLWTQVAFRMDAVQRSWTLPTYLPTLLTATHPKGR